MLTNAIIIRKAISILFYAGIFFLAISILFLRNPDPIFNPVIYAEDALWTASGLTNGWLHVLLHARTDYFVFINIFLLFISTKLSTFFSTNPLSLLPQAIAFVSFSFYSAIATFAFATLRKITTSFFSGIGFILIVLLPMGNTQNETIGRILQVGFVIPLLVVMLLFWRDELRCKLLSICVDIFLFICAATNPITLVLVFSYVIFDYSRDENFLSCIRRTGILITSFTVLAIYLLPRLGGKGGVPEDMVSSNLIEATVARPLLYPFLFPWYEKLSDAVSILLFLFLFAMTYNAYRKSGNEHAKKLILFSAVALAIYDLLSIIKRPGLTSFFSNYQNTGPDRYYVGLNVLVVFLTISCISQISRARKNIFFLFLIMVSIFEVYAFNGSLIFEFYETRQPIKTMFNFPEQICLSEPQIPLEATSRIEIYPETSEWIMSVPSRYIKKEGCNFTSRADAGIAHLGEVYKIQPSTPLGEANAIPLLMTAAQQNQNTSLNRIGVMFATYVKINQGDAVLRLRGPKGAEFIQRFSLATLSDNKYHYFNLDSKRYTLGEISGLTGRGVSTWEAHGDNGSVNTCLVYEYVDGKKRFTPGCPLDGPVRVLR